MAFSGSAYKDVQGHVDNVFDESFLSKDFLKCKVDQAIIAHFVIEVYSISSCLKMCNNYSEI